MGRFQTLSYSVQGRELAKVVFQTIDGTVLIMGSWLDASLSKVDRAAILEPLRDELAQRYGGRMPLLALKRSRRPGGESWDIWVSCGQLDTHEMYKSK